MYVSKKSREYPSEFTAADPAEKSWAVFHRADAKARAKAYADWLNSTPAGKESKGE